MSEENRPTRNGRARAARDEYLDALPVDEQAVVVRHAERVGPGRNDVDWLIARAAQQAASQFASSAEEVAGRVERAALAQENLLGEVRTEVQSAIAKLEKRLPLAEDVVALKTAAERIALRERWGPCRELLLYVAGLLTAIAIGWAMPPHRPPLFIVYAGAIALGVIGAAAYSWISVRYGRHE